MCRIVGFVDLYNRDKYDLALVVNRMRDTLIHGGPDDAGFFIDNRNGVALGHRRLSILDLSSAGHQPMSSDNGLIWITYNGEIYNFKEVKIELESIGIKFHSNSDTEVILNAYQKWGMSCVNKFKGMWSFAIYDKQTEEIILCRDRVGVKPLYWYFHNGLFIFASELKAFSQHPGFVKLVDMEALSLFFQYSYIPAPHCIFKNTYKLEPAQILRFSCISGEISHDTYWSHDNYFSTKKNREITHLTDDVCMDILDELLVASCKLRLVADVPVGVFLSGGIDSSIVSAIIQNNIYQRKIKTFSIGFNEIKYNEAPFAAKIAEYIGTDHHELCCTKNDFIEIIPLLPRIYDEPFGDSSAVPMYLLSRFARSEVKVSLSGDGGDELFYGYKRYLFAQRSKVGIFIAQKMYKIFPSGIKNSGLKNAFYTGCNIFRLSNIDQKYKKFLKILELSSFIDQYELMIRYFTDEFINCMGLNSMRNNMKQTRFINELSISDQMMHIDFKWYLPDDILVKTDRATMSVGLEGREPLLDHSLIEFVLGLPINFKYRNGISKYILKKLLSRYIPENLFKRKKQGFSIPIDNWINDLKSNDLFSLLSAAEFKKFNLLNYTGVNDVLVNGRSSDVWLLLVFQLWCNEYLC